MNEPIERATYSPEDDKLRIYSGRVSQELFDRLKEAGYRRAYKQGCFFAVWTPGREDLALELCGQIEDEDTTLADRAEDRAGRFAGYSANAGKRAEEATQASRDAVEGIPLGQPILVGHHSERRHRRALERAQGQAIRAVKEYDRRDYWRCRAKGVLRHAAHKYSPSTVFNRIKKLKAAIRKKKRERQYSQNDVAWMVQRWIWGLPDQEREYDTKLTDLSEERQAECQAHVEERIARHETWSDRWIEHLEHQIAFWQIIYDEIGGVAADQAKKAQRPLQVGGWVLPRWGTRGRWVRIIRINKGRDGGISSVTVDPKSYDENDWRDRFVVKYPDIRGYKTDEEHQAGLDGQAAVQAADGALVAGD